MKTSIVLIFIIVLAIFLNGQSGCQTPTQIIPGKNEAQKTGLDFTLIPGIGFLSQGTIIEQGETFNVGIKIKNYDQEEKVGKICITDNIDESFSGIEKDCQAFYVKSAETEEKEGGFGKKQKIIPGETEVYFPSPGEYIYENLPYIGRNYEAKLFVSLLYQQKLSIGTTIDVPIQNQPRIIQNPSPIEVSVLKSIRKVYENYKIDLRIKLRKKTRYEIYDSEFKNKDKIFFRIKMYPADLQCNIEGKNSGYINFEDRNEKLIKCSSIVNIGKEERISYPLSILLDYGVKIEKTFNFKIEVKKEKEV